jgi:hypothetical protein
MGILFTGGCRVIRTSMRALWNARAKKNPLIVDGWADKMKDDLCREN